jgi:hypothetical protein
VRNRFAADLCSTVRRPIVGAVTAFWIARDTDRYFAAVRGQLDQFADTLDDIAPVMFACTAWRLATPPALVPAHVAWHRRILSAVCSRNAWDGTLTAHVELAAPLPAPLTGSRAWWHDRGWRGWPELFGQYVDPSAQDLAKSPHLRATLRIDAPVPLAGLPMPPDDPDEVETAAQRAIVVLVRELNDLISPVIDQLDHATAA